MPNNDGSIDYVYDVIIRDPIYSADSSLTIGDATPGFEDDVYRGSYYIEPIKFSDLNYGASKIEVAQRIAKWVSEKIRYDEFGSRFFIGDLQNQKTSEILDCESGVCLAYSNLFVASARGSRIAARPIFGIKFSTDSIEYHSWVEVNFGTGWFPLEPQSGDSQLGLLQRNYIPLGVHERILKPSQAPYKYPLSLLKKRYWNIEKRN